MSSSPPAAQAHLARPSGSPGAGARRGRRDLQPVPRRLRPEPRQPARRVVGGGRPPCSCRGRGGARGRPRHRRPGRPPASARPLVALGLRPRPCVLPPTTPPRSPRRGPRPPAAGGTSPVDRRGAADPARHRARPRRHRQGLDRRPGRARRRRGARRRRPGRPGRRPPGRGPDARPRCRSPGRPSAPDGPVGTDTVRLAAGGLATSSTSGRRWSRGGARLAPPRSTPAPAARPQGPWRTVTALGPTARPRTPLTTASVVLGAAAYDWLVDRRVACPAGRPRRPRRPHRRLARTPASRRAHDHAPALVPQPRHRRRAARPFTRDGRARRARDRPVARPRCGPAS